MCFALIAKIENVAQDVGDLIHIKNDGAPVTPDELLIGDVWYINGYTVAEVGDYLKPRATYEMDNLIYIPPNAPVGSYVKRQRLKTYAANSSIEAWNDNGTWKRLRYKMKKQHSFANLTAEDKDTLASPTTTPLQKRNAIDKVFNKWAIHSDNQEVIPFNGMD